MLRLRQRVCDELTTTFASHYTDKVSLAGVLMWARRRPMLGGHRSEPDPPQRELTMPDDERYTETDRTRIEMFLAHLDDVTGGIEPRFFPVATTHEGLNGVTAVVYSEVPEPGYMMAVTYGLSLASHPQWTAGTPELCICVESVDANWALAVAFIAEQMRGECPFLYGDMLDFGGPMSEESPMSSLVFVSRCWKPPTT